MREHPILFSGAMVWSILEGRKTQTRRVVRVNSAGRAEHAGRNWHCGDPDAAQACPYGVPGDRLWVRETWAVGSGILTGDKPVVLYRADLPLYVGRWKPSIFMPHWASRITLEVTAVRVERVQEITESDATAEGVQRDPEYKGTMARTKYCWLWNELNEKRGFGWAVNPWVWVIEFKVMPAKEQP